MKKEFLKKYHIGNDGILIDIETRQRFGFFVLDEGRTVNVVPEDECNNTLSIMEKIFDDFIPPYNILTKKTA